MKSSAQLISPLPFLPFLSFLFISALPKINRLTLSTKMTLIYGIDRGGDLMLNYLPLGLPGLPTVKNRGALDW